MTARDPSKPPGQRTRADGGGRPEKWDVRTIRDALIESRGSIAEAARALTRAAIAKSDRDELRARNRRQKNKLDEPHQSSESAESIKARHDKCKIIPRRIQEYMDRHPELREARLEGRQGFHLECEDVLRAAVRDRVVRRIESNDPDKPEAYVMLASPTPLAVRTSMYVLDRQHPEYQRSVRVVQDAAPVDPLDAGGLSEEEQRRIAEEEDPEAGGES